MPGGYGFTWERSLQLNSNALNPGKKAAKAQDSIDLRLSRQFANTSYQPTQSAVDYFEHYEFASADNSDL